MGAYLSQCTCLDTLLLSKQTTMDKINALETQHTVLHNNFVSVDSEMTLVKKDITKQFETIVKRLETIEKRLETVEKKTTGMFFVHEDSDPELIVLHKGK